MFGSVNSEVVKHLQATKNPYLVEVFFTTEEGDERIYSEERTIQMALLYASRFIGRYRTYGRLTRACITYRGTVIVDLPAGLYGMGAQD